jgi:hypothetical protein
MKNTKICKVCGIEKSKIDFHIRKDAKDGIRNECKICTRTKINEYRKKNKEKTNKWNRETYHRNIEKHKEAKKRYRDNNKEKQKIRGKKYRENNKEKIKNYPKERKNHDVIFKLRCNLRSRLYNFLKSKNISKKNKTFEIVGCSSEFLKEYIENKFTEGMCWELLGSKIHIDHIIPLSSAKTEEEVYKLCHYTNLQPLWAEDNLKKSNKIIM